MNHFWANFFEHLRDCGRSATLFMLTLAVLFALLIATVIIIENDLHKYLLPAIPVLILYTVAWAGLAIRRVRSRRRQRLENRPLSFDEMRVARLKLRKKNEARRSNRTGLTTNGANGQSPRFLA